MLFQISTRRLIGHSAANSANSLWLAKGSKGVAEAAAASFLLVNTLMLLPASIVKVFMEVTLSARLTVTITFITLVGKTSKAVPQQFANKGGQEFPDDRARR
jgi:hypothetical protein